MKKNLLLAVALIALSTLAHAQIEKGTVLLGGNINFSNTKAEYTLPSEYESTSNSYAFYPSVGWALKQNTILGVELGYSHSKSSNSTSSFGQKTSNYNSSIFLRRYLTLGKGFYLFAQSGLGFVNTVSENNVQKQKGWSTSISLYPGLSYAVSKRFQIEASLGNMAGVRYSHSKAEKKVSSGNNEIIAKSNDFSFSSSLSSKTEINIGFRFFLPKKTKL